MTPQEYQDLTRHLAEIHWKNLQVIAEQDLTLNRLQQVLEHDRALQQVNSRALLAFCTTLEATFGVDHGREA